MNLLDIRNGKVYQNSESCIAAWEQEAADLDTALVESVLPKTGDVKKYNKLLIDIYETMVK